MGDLPNMATSEEVRDRLRERDMESLIVKIIYTAHYKLMQSAKKYGNDNHLLAAWALDVFGYLLVGDIERANISFTGLYILFKDHKKKAENRA